MAGFVVGVTGGIAAGKTAVTDGLAARGASVLDADVAARLLVEPGQPALAEIVATFGPGMIDEEGKLRRRALRDHVFADPEGRRVLEAILHPRIRAWLQRQCRAATSEYAVAAIPLLAEGGGRGAYPWLDRILVVDAPTALQLQRLQRRDGADPALAMRMLAAQAGRGQRLAIADDVLANDGPMTAVEDALDRLHARYRRMASERDARRARTP